MSDVGEELREKVVLSCRILAMEGLVDDILGHVSSRTADRSDCANRRARMLPASAGVIVKKRDGLLYAQDEFPEISRLNSRPQLKNT